MSLEKISSFNERSFFGEADAALLAKRDIFREFYLFNLGAFSGVLLYLWKNS
jgi:hypothetical protein